MSVLEPHQKLISTVDAAPTSESVTFGLIGPEEFDEARSVVAGLEAYPSFSDWLDCREGLQIGLSLAGVEAALIRVRLAGFALWCDLTGRSPSLRSLDAFAAFVETLRPRRRRRCRTFDAPQVLAAHHPPPARRLSTASAARQHGPRSRGPAEDSGQNPETPSWPGSDVVEQPVQIGQIPRMVRLRKGVRSEAALDNLCGVIAGVSRGVGVRWGQNCHMTV